MGLNPLQYHSDLAAERMWKNLVFGQVADIKMEQRRYMMEMFKQVKSLESDPFDDCVEFCLEEHQAKEEELEDEFVINCQKKCSIYSELPNLTPPES